MALYVCDECQCIDDTNVTRFWKRILEGEPALCSLCDPGINRWHNRFFRHRYTGVEPVINRDEEWECYTKEVAHYNRWQESRIRSLFFTLRHITILAILAVIAVIGGGFIAVEILSHTLGA